MGGVLLQDIIQLGPEISWNQNGLAWFTEASILCFKMFYKQPISLFEFLLLLISLPDKNKCQLLVNYFPALLQSLYFFVEIPTDLII